MVRTVLGHVGKPVSASTSLVLAGSQLVDSSGVPTSRTLSGITNVRAGNATYIDPYGQLQTAGANVVRYNNSTYVSSNYIRNPNAVGASTAGTNGVTPTNWFSVTANRRIVGVGTSNGMSYVDIRFAGTNPTATTLLTQWYFETSNVIPVTLGQIWTFSFYVAHVGGTLPAGFSISPGYLTLNAALATTEFLVSAGTPVSRPTSVLTRMYATRTVADATSVWANPTLWALIPVGTLDDYDFTLRIARPQFELSSTPSDYAQPPPGTIATGTSNRYSGNRILSEEARTNGVRNPRAEGSTVGDIGAGGVAPTNWALTAAAGGTFSVVGTGTDLGFPYIDVRMVATTGGAHVITFESATQTVATPAQAWTASTYCRLVAGALSTTTFAHALRSSDAGGVLISDASGAFTPTLLPQRVSTTQTTTPALTAFVSSRITITTPATAVDFTLRISAPQIELASTASSVILPVVSVPAATTRAIDNISVPMVPWYKYGTSITNRFLQSQTLDNASWAKGGGATVAADAAVAPDGTTTADRSIEGVPAGSSVIQSVTFTAGVTYTISVFVKPGTGVRYLAILMGGSATPFGIFKGAVIDPATGIVTGTTAGTTSGSSSVGSGWYRFWCTATCVTTNVAFSGFRNSQVSTDIFGNTAGDGVSGPYLWGAQLEASSTLGPYVQTVASMVTKTGAGSGTLVAKVMVPGITTGTQGVFALTDGTTANRLLARLFGNTTMTVSNIVQNTNMSGVLNTTPALVVGTPAKVALSWDATGISASFNGGTVVTDPDAPIAGATTLGIGQSSFGGQELQGEIEYITYYPFKMTAAQLQAVTI